MQQISFVDFEALQQIHVYAYTERPLNDRLLIKLFVLSVSILLFRHEECLFRARKISIYRNEQFF